jgi:Ca-activated chloride channel family protein
MDRRRLTGLAAALVFFSQLIGAAQQQTFRSSTELVSLNVTVVGPDSRPIAGLTADQFDVFEDGIRQDVEVFAAGEMPLDVVLLVDASASMAPSMALVQRAAVRFVQALRPHDRGAVMTISSGVRLLQTFSSDHTALTRAIKSTAPAGKTPLYAAIYVAIQQLDKVRRSYQAPRRQALVVLSDGHDTGTGLGFDDLISIVRRQTVAIYTVAPRPPEVMARHRELVFGESTHEQDYELRELATETGGRAFFPTAFHQINGVYDDIATELAHQYSLGYHSSNRKLDETFRRITLRVAAPGVTWRTRAGYVAEPSTASGPR